MGYRVKPFTMAVRDNSTQEFIDVGLLVPDVYEDVEEIKEEISEPLNILRVGGKNDGSEDVGALINQYTLEHSIYLPPGDYLVETPIVLKHSLFGYFSNHMYPNGCTRLNSTISSGSIITINESTEPSAIHIDRMIIEGNSNPVKAINFVPSVRVFLSCEDLHINSVQIGMYLLPTVSGSRWINIHNLTMKGATSYTTIANSYGLVIGANCHDGSYENLVILGYKIGIRVLSGGNRFTNLHIYCANGSIPTENKAEYFAGTQCLDCYKENVFDNIYLDTALQPMVQREGHSSIGNMICWNDGWFDSLNRTDGTLVTTRNDATVVINNCIVGGSSNSIKNDVFGSTTSGVIVNNFKCFWNTYYSNFILPTGKILLNDRSSAIGTTSSAGYYEIARIKTADNGFVQIIVAYGSGYWMFKIRISSAGVITSILKTDQVFAANHYYKMDGNDIVIFAYASAAVNYRVNIRQIISVSSGHENGLVNYQSYPMLERLFQTTDSGLTLITS